MMIDHNRCVAMVVKDLFLNLKLAKEAGVSCLAIKNLIVWGNHSRTSFPDVTYTTINGIPIQDVIRNTFLMDELIPKI